VVPTGRQAWGSLRFGAIYRADALPDFSAGGGVESPLAGADNAPHLCSLCAGLVADVPSPPQRMSGSFTRCFNWAIYWLVLGLFFEP